MTDLKKIRLIVLDVDGTLTDGGVYYDSQGNEMKRFDVKDGLGIVVAVAAGLEFAIITGRNSPMVERRARELGIAHLVQGAQKKVPALLALAQTCGLELEEIGYIGDDLNDLRAMKLVGFRACPADAAAEIREIADFVADHDGGHGAVRDCLQHLLEMRGEWNRAVEEKY